MENKIRRQRPIPGGRDSAPAFVIAEITRRIQADMDRFKVSRSFVIAVRLADAYGIEEQERWNTPAPKPKKDRRNRRRR